jgi:hypothetical protein
VEDHQENLNHNVDPNRRIWRKRVLEIISGLIEDHPDAKNPLCHKSPLERDEGFALDLL